MDRSTVLTIVGILVTGLSHAAKSGTFPSWLKIEAKWNAVILAVLGIAAGAIDLMANGATADKAIMTTLATSGTGLVVLLFEALGSGSGGGGGTGVVADDEKIPPAPRPFLPAVAMVGLGFAMVVLAGCVAAKSAACPLIHVADEVCPLLLVELPDGGTEGVPKADLVKMAEAQRAARLAASADAGR